MELTYAGKRIGIGRDMGMAGMGQDVNGMDNGNATGNGSTKRRLSRSRQRAGFVMIDGDGSKAESSARSRTATSVSSSEYAAVMSDTDRIIVPPIDSQPSGHTDSKQMTSPSRSRQGVRHGTSSSSVAPRASGKHDGTAGKSQGNAQKAVPFDGSNGTVTQNQARNSAVAGTRRGAHSSMTGVRTDGNGVVAGVPSSTREGGITTMGDTERRSSSVTGGGTYVPRSAVDTGVSGRVSGSQGASGSVSHGVHSAAASTVHDDAVVSSSDGEHSADADGSAVGDDGVDITGIGFTEAERRLYYEAHAPLADRIRWALAESWVPIACVIIIGVAVLLRFLMAFSSAVLTVLAIGVGVILMGSIICITYEDQKKANALADEAEMLYAAKCRIEERAARRKRKEEDTAADNNTDKRDAKTES